MVIVPVRNTEINTGSIFQAVIAVQEISLEIDRENFGLRGLIEVFLNHSVMMLLFVSMVVSNQQKYEI